MSMAKFRSLSCQVSEEAVQHVSLQFVTVDIVK